VRIAPSWAGWLDAVRGFQITSGRFPFWQPRTKSSWRTGPLPGFHELWVIVTLVTAVSIVWR